MDSEGAALIIHSVNVAGWQLKFIIKFEIYARRFLSILAPCNQGRAILHASHPWEKPLVLLDMPLGASPSTFSEPFFCVSWRFVLLQGSAGRHRSAWVAIATSMILHEFHKDEVNVHYWLPSLSVNGIDDVSWPCQVWSKSDMKQSQSWPDPTSSTKVPKSWRNDPFYLSRDVIDRVEGQESHLHFNVPNVV